MPRRKPHYPEKPWQPDPAKWNAHLVHPVPVVTQGDTPKKGTPVEPDKGWQLWRWDTLEDVLQ